MGLILYVYRAPDGDFTGGGISGRVKEITVVNVDGPFDPTPERPAFRLEMHVRGCLRLVPADAPAGGKSIGPMFGGNYAATSDSRFGAACEKLLGARFYGAVAIHDRFETPAQYDLLCR